MSAAEETWLGALDEMSAALESVDIDRKLKDSAISTTYGAQMVTRLRSTFDSIAMLLKEGRDDEAVIVLRRQLEDGMRLHYLAQNPGEADNLVAGLLLRRDKKVLSRMDSLLNRIDVSAEAKNKIQAAIGPRRSVVQKQIQDYKKLGVTPKALPELHEIAGELNRHSDLVVYSSTSDVSHSSISGITHSYRRIDQDGSLEVTLTSNDFTGTLTYTRSVITSTTIAVASSLRLMGLEEEAVEFTRAGAEIEARILNLLQGPDH